MTPAKQAAPLLLLVLALAGCRREAAPLPPAAGEALFAQHCSACHAVHRPGIGPALAGPVAQRPHDWLVRYVRDPQGVKAAEGRAIAMPPFAFLSDGELDALLAYVAAEAAAAPPARATCDSLRDGLPPADPPHLEPPRDGTLALEVERWIQAPPSSDTPPRARLNMLRAAPDGRLFVNDLRGTLYAVTGDTLAPYLALPPLRPAFFHEPGLGTGFGAFAFHPAFAANGLLYTSHAEHAGSAPADFSYDPAVPVALQWVLTEWKAADPSAPRFEGTSRELLRLDLPHTVHGVQDVAFAPAPPGTTADALLYVAVGDGGATILGYPELTHSLHSVLGTVLRIDPAGRDGRNGRYGIPPGNPFAGRGDALPEIWAWGLRNPHRLTWDPARPDRLFIADIGEGGVEEINLGRAGADYGWNVREGPFAMDACLLRLSDAPLDDGGLRVTYPVARYDHHTGKAISGGPVYRGTRHPALDGLLLFGDIPTGQLFYLDVDDVRPGRHAPVYRLGLVAAGVATTLQALQEGRVDVHLAEAGGELYLLTKRDGLLWRVRRVVGEAAPTAAAASGASG